MLVLCVIGAYALNNTMQSVYVLLLFGVFGYALVKLGFPLAPLILGVILGDQIELNLVRAIMTRFQSLAFRHPPDFGRAAARIRALRRRSHLAASAASGAYQGGGGGGLLSAAWSPSRSHDREESASAHDPCAADGSVFREGW